MTAANGLEALSSGVILSPFTQLRRLLEGIAPGHDNPIELTVGEPREAMPGFVIEKLKEAEEAYTKYPPIRGTDEFRNAIANWIARRYGADVAVDPATEILPLNGSREGLFYACLPAAGRKRVSGRPAIMLPNPYYAAYIGGALAVNAEPIFLNATEATGHLPDLGSVASDTALLDRTVAFFLCSPANPQGAVADAAYVRRALDLARRHDFMLFFDECYSEIYAHEPPVGELEVGAVARLGSFPQLDRLQLAVQAVKPTRAPVWVLRGRRGLHGDVRGDPQPGRAASAGAHAASLGRRLGGGAARCCQPAGLPRKIRCLRRRFRAALWLPAARRRLFLWLDLSRFGGSEAATLTLWKRCGVKVVPGAYLAKPGADRDQSWRELCSCRFGSRRVNHIREALGRVVSVLS